MSSAIHAEIPDQLWLQVQNLVRQGWASSMEEVVNESLRRYLESHQDVLAESMIDDDIEWGLHGNN